MSFSTSAEVDIVLEDRSVRAARKNLESELGSVPVGATDGGTVGAQSAGGPGGGRARRRARREHRWARERTDYAEEQAAYLEEIEDHLAEGALGGGGGGIFDNLIGSVTETAGDTAIEAGDTALELGTGAIGSVIGNTVANAISGNKLGVKKPGWIPIEVEDVDSIDVDTSEAVGVEGADAIPLRHPDSIPVDAPTLKVEDPSPLGVADPSPLSVEDPSPLEVEGVDPIPVDAPESIPVAFEMSGSGDGATNTKQDGKMGAGGLFPFLLSPAAWAAQKTGAADQFAKSTYELDKHIPGSEIFSEGLYGVFNQIPGMPDRKPPHERYNSGSNGASSKGASPRIEAITYDNDVKFGDIAVTADVDYNELDRLEDEILDEVDDRVADAIDDLRKEIERGTR